MNLLPGDSLLSLLTPARTGEPLDLLAGILALAVVVAWARLLWWQHRAPHQSRAHGWRMAALLAMQPICAALLYFTLLPPRVPTEAGTLVVATAQATPTQLRQQPGDALVALPEAPALAGVDRVPDLATALRRRPGTQRLRIVGAGLEPRDREAVAGLSLAFESAALPRGLIRLEPPARVAPGAAFAVAGQVHGIENGWVELIDPAGRRTDVSALTKAGDFSLQGSARAPGQALFKLRLRDGQRKLLEETEVPVWTAADPAPRLLLLAGAPGPEVKYLRRWASDAGLSLHTQLSVGGGVQLGDAPLALNATSLQAFDLVVLDERSWAGLSANERSALLVAVRNGLGMLLRVTGPLPESTRRQWQALGISLSASTDIAPLKLPAEVLDDEALRARRGAGSRDAMPASEGEASDDSELTRRSVRIDSADAAPLLRDDQGTVVANWRAQGRGRIAVWTPTDSYRLVLSGQADRYGEVWSETFAVLARPQARSTPRLDAQPRPQQRMALCNLTKQARVVDPQGNSTPLLVDPATGAAHCAAYWPQQPGWHQLFHGEAETEAQAGANAAESTWPFFVYTPNAAPGLHANELRDSTFRLVSMAVAVTARSPTSDHAGRRGPSWPWLLAWLISAAAVWWLERARVGKPSVPA